MTHKWLSQASSIVFIEELGVSEGNSTERQFNGHNNPSCKLFMAYMIIIEFSIKYVSITTIMSPWKQPWARFWEVGTYVSPSGCHFFVSK